MSFLPKRKGTEHNIDVLNAQRSSNVGQYRNVQESQQLRRTQLGTDVEKSRKNWLMAAIAISVGIALGVYLMIGIFSYVGSSLDQYGSPSGSSGDYSGESEKADSIDASCPSASYSGKQLDPWVHDIPYTDASDRVAKQPGGVPGWRKGCPVFNQLESLNSIGNTGRLYATPDQVPQPQWYKNLTNPNKGKTGHAKGWINSEHSGGSNFFHYIIAPTWLRVFFTLLAGGIAFGFAYVWAMKRWQVNTSQDTVDDINQYPNDTHVMLHEEMFDFDIFPDAGAHATQSPSSMLSHVMLSNKGLKHVDVPERCDKDVYAVDDDGTPTEDVDLYEGEPVLDDDGNFIMHSVPIIDEKFGEALFDASELPNERKLRVHFNATKIPYNPPNSTGHRNRDKLDYDTWADVINADWVMPDYEPQTPAGAYIIDTAPVNTMVLAITRAGKGQTYIEPVLDMWTREKDPNNFLCNDPKGELLVKFYVRATMRGYQVQQFNLINVAKTDIYNPMALASDCAREGDFQKCASYIEAIAQVFFPVEGSDDPVWPNAANNAFKRAAYGLIDYYLEEEHEIRLMADRTKMDPKVLDTKLDNLWGHVTLYNCYQLFVQLTAKKKVNPLKEIDEKSKNGEFDGMDDATKKVIISQAKKKADLLWGGGKAEVDLLSLYFSATAALPMDYMRRLVGDADNALKSMGGAEKMLASVYGIAITAMAFFTDPTISTMTSGTPSQSVDLSGLSFPRRFGVRFDTDYMREHKLIKTQAVWDCFTDDTFTTPFVVKGKPASDFKHTDMIRADGWARAYFRGIFPTDTAYMRLRIVDPQDGSIINTFHFRFEKMYATTLDGTTYIKDEILGDRVVKNGVLVEMCKYRKAIKDANGNKTGKYKVVYLDGKKRFKTKKIEGLFDKFDYASAQNVMSPILMQTSVHYSEKPKAIFLVTPPHLKAYAKLILILIRQLVDASFDQSYMTKSNQKPLYKTRYMLDEVGNLQSEGHGIANLDTMLSIGLGQDQQFTLILQNLAQLRAVYGENVDDIVQANTSNIVFLKSNDQAMLEKLSKLSGTTHESKRDSKTVTTNENKYINKTKGDVSYTIATHERQTIEVDDMLNLQPRCSIVLRAGNNPIWNRNETILPMSWRLFQNTIVHPGHNYTLQTIPTTSTAAEFDLRNNQPDFEKMLAKRIDQAMEADDAARAYQTMQGYSDSDMAKKLGEDNTSNAIMEIINAQLRKNAQEGGDDDDEEYYDEEDTYAPDVDDFNDGVHDNEDEDYKKAIAENSAEQERANERLFANGTLAPSDFYHAGQVNRAYESDIIEAFVARQQAIIRDTAHFIWDPQSKTLSGIPDAEGKGGGIYITAVAADPSVINNAAKDPDTRTYAEENIDENDNRLRASWMVNDPFFKFLASQDSWDFADGQFDKEMASLVEARDSQ